MMNKQVKPMWLLVCLIFLFITTILLRSFFGLYAKSYQAFFDGLNVFLSIFIDFLAFIVCLLLIFKVIKTFYEKFLYIDINMDISFSNLLVLGKSFTYFLVAAWATLTLPLSIFLLIGKILEIIVYFS